MKRYLLMFICFMIIGYSGSRVEATTQTTLSYELIKPQKIGDTYELSLEISDVLDLYGFSLDFVFDSSFFEVVEVNTGSLFDGSNAKVLVNKVQDNKVNFVVTLLGEDKAVQTKGEFVKIKLKALTAGEKIVDRVEALSELKSMSILIKLSDSKGQKIPASGLDNITFVQIEPETVENKAPTISGAKDQTIKMGDQLDLRFGITANDYEDGDLTCKINVKTDLDVNKMGTYSVTYSVKDSHGVMTTQTIIVTVIGNGVPVISGVVDLEIDVKSLFDPLEHITASDLEDGDLTSQIVVTGSVDVNQLGEYSLMYTVTDHDGNQTTANRLVTVVDRVAPIIVLNGESHIKLEIGEVYHELGAAATDNVDDQVEIEILGTVNVNEIGSYTITYRATDQSGNQSELTRVIEVLGKQVLFPDVELGKWYTTHIQEFASLGYIKGYSDGMFKPQNSITRAEFVKIVNNAFGLVNNFKPVTDLPFTDLDSQWKKDELKLALAAGYITPATEFRHNAPINRQEAAKIIGYLLGDKLSNDSDWKFADSHEITTWAKEYVAGLVEVGVLSKNQNFRPKDPITRAEAVKMLNIARRL